MPTIDQIAEARAAYQVFYRDATGLESVMPALDADDAENTAQWLRRTGATEITVQEREVDV